MYCPNLQKNYVRQLPGLAMATAILTCIFAVPGYSGNRSRSSDIAQASATTTHLIQAQTGSARANGKIAFVSNVGNTFDIFTMNSDGSGRAQLTSNGFNTNPSISPDGNKIAFYSGGGINLMNADGSNKTFLTPGFDNKMSWSPDGRKIVFTCGGICIIGSDGSNRVQISHSYGDFAPAWSPDGTRIAFTSNRDGNNEIYIMNGDGSNPRRLTNNSLSDYKPSWSPDGLTLAFTEWAMCVNLPNGEVVCFASIIVIMNADGSNQRGLTGGSIGTLAGDPSWSPDGSRIAFQGSQITGSNSKPEIFSINVNGGGWTNLTNTADIHEATPDWGSLPAAALPCANPIDCPEFFVRQQYLDFLLRDPDTAGYNDWLNVLKNCGLEQGGLGAPVGCDRVHVSSGFFRSAEFGERGYWIYRFFEGSLGRRPQYAEFMPELSGLSGLLTGAQQEARRADFITRFMQRPEFTNIYAGISDSAHASLFIAKLEEKARVTLPETVPPTQQGQPPQYGRQEIINLMASGQLTPAQTLRAFIEQKIVWDTYFYRAFVAMQYFGYLRRDPESAGYDDWVDVLTNGRASAGIAPGDYRHLIFGFIYSVEYRERFSKQ